MVSYTIRIGVFVNRSFFIEQSSITGLFQRGMRWISPFSLLSLLPSFSSIRLE